MSYKQTVQYKDIALFMSKKGAHSAISNSGAGLTFLPNVQSINFSVDVGIEKINSISSDQTLLKTIHFILWPHLKMPRNDTSIVGIWMAPET